jgi:hypothetical protein
MEPLDMIKQAEIKQPKTHSDILWHFTGGKTHNIKNHKESKNLKSLKTAFEILKTILKTKNLKVGSYHEYIKCVMPSQQIYNDKNNRLEIKKNVPSVITTSPVCCVADIPLSELFHHGKRYGKIAIGFKRNSLIKAGFNPVFYTLHTTEIIQNFFHTQNSLEQSDFGIEDIVSDIENEISTLECESCGNEQTFCNVDLTALSDSSSDISAHIDDTLELLSNTLAFIKTFDRTEFNTIYSEREWRSVMSFEFNWNDVAALILPRKNGYHQKFINDIKPNLKLPSTIKVYCWEEI